MYLCNVCTRTLTIRSKEKLYYPGRSHLTYGVPCGHCPSCQQKKEDDWFLRIWKEVKDYNEVGGRVVFVTLTVSPQHVAYFDDVAEYTDVASGEVYDRFFHIPYCDKHKMEAFMKAFLKPLERKGFTGKTLSKPIKYFWPGEYGMADGKTHRPHFHPLLFLPPEVVASFKSKQALKDEIAKHWHYGWVRWSKEKDGGMFVTSEFAARYVSKYVFKDDGWTSQPQVREYLFDHKGKIIKSRWQRLKSYLPTHWQSKHFGESFTEYCENDLVFRDGIDFSFVTDIQKGRRKVYSVPSYIERKCLYEVKDFLVSTTDLDEFGEEKDYFLRKQVLQLNERGKLVKSTLLDFDEKLEKMLKHNTDYLNLEKVKCCVSSDSDLQEFNSLYGCSYVDCSDIVSAFDFLAKDIDFTALAAYQLALKGFSYNSKLKRDCVARMCTDSFVMEARKVYYDRFLMSPLDAPFFYDEGFVQNKIAKNLFCLEDCSKFATYNEYLQLAQHLEDFYRLKCKSNYMREKKLLHEFKMSVS